ncbi:2-amino-4-hydroxy-6-hydroxymethyldihydropteridine diphosphokinase [Roseospira marina]|uniref:2-amino-4-hydroxy-6-hydroxymethyldihydropteridine pyrophosphokinase n=1 Tax=Roseospira marina TaxID=140057 RepID=A0A5M6IFJ7_9PROT|nr:2-amino-4-hydroxy-6-hydroxymethyldihydropteridine diphosphokinase [Roseospira marina]KAA5606707.1 2-amino-4-hydroxy-6-hydroxymethyldihydropteridine diphosphokinase [Roseospira marina]MBB4313880.1 2-amino-4-hydroxy-6-hydroxymethyldihydropteridine diphosphokinase [Roseospira marina]MBB5087042.1 2-amino-4-hydroxy-6-hydroxymethyldihydropteridine diphosphokinase [Roseospira marina]
MILIALGSNLPGPGGTPRATVEAALAALSRADLSVVACSPWYRSAPVPPSDQPWFVNGVARIAFDGGGPADLMARLHTVEAAFGRRRDGTRNAARTLDLDLLDFDGAISDAGPILPHPRLTDRAFVLLPLADVASDWRHPVDGRPVADLVAALGPIAGIERDETEEDRATPTSR